MSIDFQKLRSQIPMALVLEIIGFHPKDIRGPQKRGPCPIHRSVRENSRSFSVNTTKGAFRCFGCGKHGNQLDLYAAVTGLPLFEAARELCQKAGVPLSHVTKSNP
jgi:DNA primase